MYKKNRLGVFAVGHTKRDSGVRISDSQHIGDFYNPESLKLVVNALRDAGITAISVHADGPKDKNKLGGYISIRDNEALEETLEYWV